MLRVVVTIIIVATIAKSAFIAIIITIIAVGFAKAFINIYWVAILLKIMMNLGEASRVVVFKMKMVGFIEKGAMPSLIMS